MFKMVKDYTSSKKVKEVKKGSRSFEKAQCVQEVKKVIEGSRWLKDRFKKVHEG